MIKGSIPEYAPIEFQSPAVSTNQDLAKFFEPHWYVVYTYANHERRVTDQLTSRGIEHFLPQYESVRRWKDRKVRLHFPLFPGYVFVQLAEQNYHRVRVPGIVDLIRFNGRAVTVPPEQVIRVREFLNQGFRVEPHPYLQMGRRVRVVRGPLEGMEGVIVRRKNGNRFVISFASIQRSIAVEVSGLELRPAVIASVRSS